MPMYFDFFVIMIVLITHYLADFLLQFPDMKAKKGRNTMEGFYFLTLHCALYAVITTFIWKGLFGMVSIYYTELWGFLFLAHLAVDFVTSRITTYLYTNQKYNSFFNVIGFDQVLHYAQLFWFLILFH